MLKKDKPLTPRRLEILQTIEQFMTNQHFSPTIQEIARQLGKSRSTVYEHCVALQESGLLSASPLRARSLKLTPQAEQLLQQMENECCQPDELNEIPLYGTVAAGMPVETSQNYDTISITNQFGSKEVFALRVSGESMIEENINPGDHVICRKADSARDGDLVIACVDDTETTLKRFYREKNCIRLEPANKNYQPILTQNCKIQAKVIGLIRKF